MIIKARERGIAPGEDVTEKIIGLLAEIKDSGKPATLLFEKGDYFFDSDKCASGIRYITNTIAEKEWRRGETPNLAKACFWLSGIKDLTIDGGGARFIARGQASYILAEGCERLTVKNCVFTAERPDLHELEAVEIKNNRIDFKLDSNSDYKKKGREFRFDGKDYDTPLKYGARKMWNWIARFRADDKNTIERVAHPLRGALVSEKEKGVFRARYFLRPDIRVGDKFYIFEIRRLHNGIIAMDCRDVALENVAMDFNYALAFVAQNCENVTLDKLRFAPPQDGSRLLASIADFVQICMCRGKIRITDSYFEGAGDDALNVHGFHFKIVSKDGKRVKVKFMHPQSFGFNPFRAGDKVEIVDPLTLLAAGEAEIVSSELKGLYEIELVLDGADAAKAGMVIEDVSACPDLYYAGNTLDRIITRGILVTTRGKVVIENNRFLSTSMHSILFSDDAKSWYESGPVSDVTVRNNYFGRCAMYNLCIYPENLLHKGAVHGDFLIENNEFNSYPNGGAQIKSTKSVVFKGNKFKKDFPLSVKNAEVRLEKTENEFTE